MNKVKHFLVEYDIQLSKKFTDGRINSIQDESTLIKILVEQFDFFEEVPDRFWCDIYIVHICDNDTVIKFPVNIKVTGMKNADNSCSPTVLLHCFTSIDLTKKWARNYNNTKICNSCLINNKTETERDYYYLVYNKDRANIFSNVVVSSIKSLSTVTINSCNLPFQIVWGKNTLAIKRTFEQSWKLIIEDTYFVAVTKILEKYNMIADHIKGKQTRLFG